MDNYLWGEVIKEARKLQPEHLHFETRLKVCEVLREFEYERKTYSPHRYEKGVPPDTLRLPPTVAKPLVFDGTLQIIKGGFCDIFRIGQFEAYRPWRTASEEAAPNREDNLWLRVRISKPIIPVLALSFDEFLEEDPEPKPHRRLDPFMGRRPKWFYIPVWFLRRFGFTFEGEPLNFRQALEVAVPQALKEAEPAKV